jgi:hypothetical protein
MDAEELSDVDAPQPKRHTEAYRKRRLRKKAAQRANKAKLRKDGVPNPQVFLPNGDITPEKLQALDKEAESMIQKARVNCSKSRLFIFMTTLI